MKFKKSLVAVGAVLLISTSLCAGNKSVMKVDLKEKKYEVEYLEVKTSKSVFRIYPCGKIDKLIWKEIHKNEDDSIISIGGWSTPTPGVEYLIDNNGAFAIAIDVAGK